MHKTDSLVSENTNSAAQEVRAKCRYRSQDELRRQTLSLKLLTILGTRPEFIRLSRIIERLDGLCCQLIVHTGQNYDVNLNEVFFQELGIRTPNYYLGAQGSFGEQMSTIMTRIESVLLQEKPDRFLVLGDTNSSLAAIVAKRMGIPVYHMEAGNRCYDDRVPEEVNRRIIDHCSDVLMPYTHRSKENLLREGIERQRIFVTGNPIFEVLNYYASEITASSVLERFRIEPGSYFLVTLHRAENVDVPERLAQLLQGLDLVAETHRAPVIVSLHPRTATNMDRYKPQHGSELVHFSKPFGFFDFAKLERHAHCVLTDSGTVQEECAILGIPNVTVRDTTERAETIECGSSILSGSTPQMLVQAIKIAVNSSKDWRPPGEYLEPRVSDTVTKIVLGFQP
jgi:UDP-N-acetylglucosamine 2-epimerase (non-hydrolysing)